MTVNLDIVKTERRAKNLPRRRHDLAKSIREAILALGGEAHRRSVIEALAREFGVDVLHIPGDLEAAVIRSFEDTLRDDAQRAAFGFHLPFGEGSHRWGVKIATHAAN
jgi:DNA-directed RNA polymerase specialized sigma subunit